MNIGFIYAFGTAIIWGLTYTIEQKMLTVLSPTMILFANSVIASLIMLPFIFFGDSSVKAFVIYSKANFVIVALSIILPIIANILLLTSIKSLGASTASIIEIAYPFFVVIFSLIFFKVAPSFSFYIGGLLIFAGASIIAYFY